MPIGVLTPPFVGVYGPRPYEKKEKATQITDEMVAEACFIYQQQGNMRAALEAALGARSGLEDVK